MIKTGKITVKSEGHTDIIDITMEVAKVVERSKTKSGSVVISVPGSTASITTMEYEHNLVRDFKEILKEIAPYKKKYEHHKTWGDDNGAAHIRASLLGPSLTIPFEKGKLLLGSWQQIVFMDFDTRPRNRDIVIQIIGD